MEHSRQYHPLNEIVNKYNLELNYVINAWINHDIPLYIRMEGLPCKLSCVIREDNDLFFNDERSDAYVSRDFLFGEKSLDSIEPNKLIVEKYNLDIIQGNDIYQSELSCQFTERQFHLERGTEISYMSFGSERLCYSGFAHGYWQVKPGASTRFVTGKYKIANTNPLISDSDSSCVLKVYGIDDLDYLIFNGEIEVDRAELYISSDGIKNITDGYFVDLNIDSKKTIIPRVSKQERRALYILLHEICKKKNLQTNATSMANILTALANNDYGKNWEFNEETIRNWLTESKLK